MPLDKMRLISAPAVEWLQTNAVPLGRTCLALALAFTLALNSTDVLFDLSTRPAFCRAGNAWLAFCWGSSDNLWLVRVLGILLSALVISGQWARVSGPCHAFFAYSLSRSIQVADGGDIIASNLALLLTPLCIAAPAACRWSSRSMTAVSRTQNLYVRASLIGVAVQMAVVYFDAAITKTVVQEWRDGTALYYVLVHPVYGGVMSSHLLHQFIRSEFIALVTWSVIALELALAFAWFGSVAVRMRLLALAIGFHLGIALLHGLPTFALSMIGGLLLYLAVPQARAQDAPAQDAAASSRAADERLVRFGTAATAGREGH